MDGWSKGHGLSASCAAGSCAERHQLYVIVDSSGTACSSCINSARHIRAYIGHMSH